MYHRASLRRLKSVERRGLVIEGLSAVYWRVYMFLYLCKMSISSANPLGIKVQQHRSALRSSFHLLSLSLI